MDDVEGKGFVIKDKRSLDDKGELKEEKPDEKLEKGEEAKPSMKLGVLSTKTSLQVYKPAIKSKDEEAECHALCEE